MKNKYFFVAIGDNESGIAVLVSLTIPVPDDVQASLEGEWGDLARHLQESLAVDGYSKGRPQPGSGPPDWLGMATRLEAQEFLGRRGVAVFDFDPAELDREAALLKTVAVRDRSIVSGHDSVTQLMRLVSASNACACPPQI